jgi:hypothetical protein
MTGVNAASAVPCVRGVRFFSGYSAAMAVASLKAEIRQRRLRIQA